MRQTPLLGLLLAATLSAAATHPAGAQNPFEPLVYVNDSAVTRYERDQRLRFMQLLRAPNATPEGAERELVNDRLKAQAARQLGIAVSDEALQGGLAEFAGRANLSTDQFLQALAQGGVEPQAYRDFVRIGLAWREVIRQRIVPGVRVAPAEIDQALRREVERPIIDRVLLSEIIIPAPPGREEAALAQAQALVASRPSEAEFAAAARRLSATGTAARGGRLEWTALDDLPPTLRPIVSALSPGQVTAPLTVPGAVVLFLLRDAQGDLRPGAAEQILDYAVLSLNSAAEAAAVLARVDTCDDLQAEGGGATRRQTESQNAIPTLTATRLASLDGNEASVLGGEVVMLCSRQPALVANAAPPVPTTAQAPDGVEAATEAATDPLALPDRTAVQDQLFNQRIEALSEGYLAELRADAVIRRP